MTTISSTQNTGISDKYFEAFSFRGIFGGVGWCGGLPRYVRKSRQSLATLIFLILALTLCLTYPASADTVPPATRPAHTATTSAADGVKLIGKITDPAIPESSGVVASRRHPGVFWTHNDSGNPPFLYAIRADGSLIRAYPVKAPSNRDWEDIAIDSTGHLYIGEIGNNGARFRQIAVYRVDEPDPAALLAPGQEVPILIVNRTWQLRFPHAQPFDCESLFIHNGHGYVCSKLFTGQRSGLYRFPLDDNQLNPATLELLGRLPIRWPVTAADISPDAQRLAIMTNAGPYLFKINGDPSSALKLTPTHITYLSPSIEACCFVPKPSTPKNASTPGLLATCESREVLWFYGREFMQMDNDGE